MGWVSGERGEMVRGLGEGWVSGERGEMVHGLGEW